MRLEAKLDMSLIINGTERDTLIIGNSVYRYIGEYAKVATANANTHNATYRGQSLGSFNETFANDIDNGTFNNMWVGDYFTVNNHKYKIAGFNYKCGHEENTGLANHLIMITDVLGTHDMNSSDTTEGGFAGSSMFKDEIPVVEKQLATDFGEHLLKFKSYLSTSIDSSGAPNNGQWYELTANLCNSAMWWGSPSQYSNNKNGTKYNIGDEDTQLPIMKLHTAEQSSGSNYVWLRDIYSSSDFINTPNENDGYVSGASAVFPVRAFFLID
mgnify:CR=1 FL=1